MHGCVGRCLQGSAGRQQSCRKSATEDGASRCNIGLLLSGCAVLSLVLSVQAHAQGTTLPPVTVEGRAPKAAKKSATTPAPKAALQQQAPEPEPLPQTAESRDKARSEAVYNTPASVSTAGKSELDLAVENGDILFVDRAPSAYIYGEVQKPGQFRIERGMSLMQALAQAGGLTAKGTERGIKLHRRDANGNVTISEPRMNEPVQRDDVFYVKESLF